MLNYSKKLALLLFATLFIVGCGDTEEYVFTGTSPVANTGSLTYNFTQPQAQTVYGAPAGTESIRFELYTGDNGSGDRVVDETRDYASSVTLTNVPASVRSSVLTFFGDNGVPLTVVTVASPVVIGQNTVVNFNGAVATAVTFNALNVTPENLQLALNQTANLSIQASFSNGQTVNLAGNNTTANGTVSYDVNPAGVVNVSANGQVRALAEGNATVTVTVELGNVTRTDSVAVSVGNSAPVGEYSAIQVSPTSGTLLVNETATLTVTATAANNQTATLTAGDFNAVSSNPSIVSVNETSGALVVQAAGIGNATVTVTYTGDNAANNATLNATATFTVNAGSDSNFNTFTLGEVDGQNGFSNQGNMTAAVAVVSRTGSAFADFGSQALRVEGNTVENIFNAALQTPPLAVRVGESTAAPLNETRNNTFDASFDFTTSSEAYQAGLRINISPSDFDEGRQSVIRLVDNVNGTDIVLFNYERTGPNTGEFTSGETIVSNLSRTTPHNVRIVWKAVDGPGTNEPNDELTIYVDGTVVHTGTGWEDYFRNTPALASPTLVDRLLFQIRPGMESTVPGAAFLFNNIRVTSSNT